jgi:aspartate aminotransferase-like enzyme
MKLFTPGPVNLNREILDLGETQEPYFRTEQFSEMTLETISKFHSVLNLAAEYSIFFIPGSGTTAMECAAQFIPPHEQVISFETGIFGERFSEIIRRRGDLALTTIKHDINDSRFEYEDRDGTRNLHFTLSETSTGYNLNQIELPKAKLRKGLVIVDAVTALFTEEIDLNSFDIIYSASQKGICCSPGIGIVICSPKATEQLKKFAPLSLNLDPRIYLENIIRGQTPFTPPINVLRQIHRQVTSINDHDGYKEMVRIVETRATNFRKFLSNISAELLIENQANCVTNFKIRGIESRTLTIALEEIGIQVAQNSPHCYPDYVRVAHFGNQSDSDYEILQNALKDMSGNI